ncbi:carboxylate-amine ligase [Amycolatopsis mediterranei S699]|uniref:Putative glutamate--cysteine ligase 2 n=2 Tax=Amycolatopsis mediterranei TaxID=33910 RepID=A0A0H3D6W9_AMYMU|nr:glutamate--cysteine ligase [Amycolatopsis mediterranei]ADJ46072.1 carboxylate-amine ligase [Amycolatopsis mediterranei U32]AEK42858.1 carboxylate-amine ligase [Amycolatopsis mediterranei S699]AFO77783.1 carboxylate-amine ligase [Amycolatopsis mediterranei S699]AGT84911.1 carboxylate-amine ligase [Amycolatopsis mediterranei RB]KDU88001.1 carboxylate--amine ligase [Amycolatopsis mediterranei]
MSDGPPTMGVEEEFLLVNPRTGQASPCAEPVLARYRHHGPLPDGVRMHRELRLTQLEAASGVCTTADELRHQLTAARRVLAGAAAAEDCALLATGTPVEPGPATPPPASTGRYAEIDAAYGAVVADYEACGCHVHVGVPDPDTAVAVVNHLGRWLPTLLALSGNSPFDHGRDTGYDSWRMVLQSRFPGSGVAPHLRGHAEYRRAVETLVDCGALVDPDQTFWLARPSGRFPTVEFRVADTALTVDHAVLQALLSRALVQRALTDLAAGREAAQLSPQVAAAAVWAAARYGLSGELVDAAAGTRRPAWTLVDELLEHVRTPLEESGDLAEVRKLVDAVRSGGTGAAQQRAVADDGMTAVRWLAAATVPVAHGTLLTG